MVTADVGIAGFQGMHGDVVCVQVSLPDAEAVYLMGPFNNWSTTRTPMVYAGRQRWEARVPAKAVAGPLRVFVWDAGQRCGHLLPAGIELTLGEPMEDALASVRPVAPRADLKPESEASDSHIVRS